jgi:DNA-binding MarR family transcriptional regulator
MLDPTQNSDASVRELPLLTNHAYVLASIAQHPDLRMREIAAIVGLTERAVQRIVEELIGIGYVAVTKSGRRNQYHVRSDSPLQHPLTKHRSIGELISFVSPQLATKS